MSAQLEQILGYLDREGVTEIVISVGRPIAMRKAGTYASLTATPLSLPQVEALILGSPLAALVPATDGAAPTTDVDIGRRRVRVQAGRRAGEIVLKIETAPGGRPPVASRAPTPVPTARPTPAPVAQPVAQKPPPPLMGDFEPDEEGLTLELEDHPRGGAPVAAKPVTATPASPKSLTPTPTPAPAPKPTPKPVAKPIDTKSFAGLVAAARDRRATDLHVSTARMIAIRCAGELLAIDPGAAPLSVAAAEGLLLPLLSAAQREQLDGSGYVDLAIDAPGGGRLRANISRHQNGLKGTFRLALAQPMGLEELGLPKELAKVVAHHQGFVVIAGPSGHGKTTTLAALVDLINGSKPFHILTIEDPIEIIHPRKVAVVSQREAGHHTVNFASGLKASLREDPDVIVIGELRDRETVEIALTAAETGHLVISTMSTPSAAKTIDRLIDMFPPEEHSQVRASIAGALRAIVAQRLLPAASGDGVVPAIELVTGVLPLVSLIRDDKLYQLPNLMQRGRAFGMIRFDESLLELVRAGRITEDVALAAADSKKDFAVALKRPPGAQV